MLSLENEIEKYRLDCTWCSFLYYLSGNYNYLLVIKNRGLQGAYLTENKIY